MTSVSLRAVVTGASSGIGRQIAIELAKQSQARQGNSSGAPAARIVVHYRGNESGANETASAVERFGAQTVVVKADLCDRDARTHLIESSWDFLGQPTTWINNAGADVLTGDAAKWSFEKKIRVLMDTDVLGTIQLSRCVTDRLSKEILERDELPDSRFQSSQPPPSMTFIGWDQAPLGMEGQAGQMFGPVKAAVMAFAVSLAQEVSPMIRVNTVAPGWIQTSWGETTDSYWDQRAKRQALMNRWGTPADVAKAVWYVADPENTFCTGQTILANGGWDRTLRR